MKKNNCQRKHKISLKTTKKSNPKRKITKSLCRKSPIKSRQLKRLQKPQPKKSSLKLKPQLLRQSKLLKEKRPLKKTREETSKIETRRRSTSCQGNYQLMQTKVPNSRWVGWSKSVLYESLQPKSKVRNGEKILFRVWFAGKGRSQQSS